MTVFVASDVGAAHSGVATVVRELSVSLAALDNQVSVISKESGFTPKIEGVHIHSVRSTAELAYKVYSSDAKVVAVHGFWAPPLVAGCMAAIARGQPVLLSPHGMFSPYSFSRRGWRKQFVLALGGRQVLKRVSAFHATCDAEADEIRALGLEQPIYIIPNGVNLPPLLESPPKDTVRTVLFMSRIHPKKGILLLLRVWASLANTIPNWRLVIAGPDEEGHAAEVSASAASLGVELIFLGTIEGDVKAKALAEADLFILPSANENFGIVIAEALAAGTPVITTTGTPWRGLQTHRAGWWVQQEYQSLKDALAEATSLPSETLAGMGLRGRAFVADTFSWGGVAASYAEALEEIEQRARAPVDLGAGIRRSEHER